MGCRSTTTPMIGWLQAPWRSSGKAHGRSAVAAALLPRRGLPRCQLTRARQWHGSPQEAAAWVL